MRERVQHESGIDPLPLPVCVERNEDQPATDDRFRRLVPRAAWDALPEDVRRRFSKRLTGQAAATYSGEIVWTRLSTAGWLLAQICRLIGAPLPLAASGPAPAAVAVSEDRQSGGQCWTRLYGRERGHPQVIHSAKSFSGATGLEEHIGGGFGHRARARRGRCADFHLRSLFLAARRCPVAAAALARAGENDRDAPASGQRPLRLRPQGHPPAAGRAGQPAWIVSRWLSCASC